MRDRNEEHRGTILAEVNGEIRALADRLDPWREHDWEFCCECGDESCTETVSVSLVEYDETREDALPVLASDHVARAREVRAQSESLRESAEALKAEARHPLERARRLGQT